MTGVGTNSWHTSSCCCALIWLQGLAVDMSTVSNEQWKVVTEVRLAACRCRAAVLLKLLKWTPELFQSYFHLWIAV